MPLLAKLLAMKSRQTTLITFFSIVALLISPAMTAASIPQLLWDSFLAVSLVSGCFVQVPCILIGLTAPLSFKK